MNSNRDSSRRITWKCFRPPKYAYIMIIASVDHIWASVIGWSQYEDFEVLVWVYIERGIYLMKQKLIQRGPMLPAPPSFAFFWHYDKRKQNVWGLIFISAEPFCKIMKDYWIPNEGEIHMQANWQFQIHESSLWWRQINMKYLRHWLQTCIMDNVRNA